MNRLWVLMAVLTCPVLALAQVGAPGSPKSRGTSHRTSLPCLPPPPSTPTAAGRSTAERRPQPGRR